MVLHHRRHQAWDYMMPMCHVDSKHTLAVVSFVICVVHKMKIEQIMKFNP